MFVSSLTVCDHCGGPANWTFFGDIPHFHCQSQCDGFMQMGLELAGDVATRYLDRVRSVSAQPEPEPTVWPDATYINEQHRRFLNGT